MIKRVSDAKYQFQDQMGYYEPRVVAGTNRDRRRESSGTGRILNFERTTARKHETQTSVSLETRKALREFDVHGRPRGNIHVPSE